MTVSILNGDCRDVLAGLEPDSFDSCVTDPPYHLTSIVKRFGSETAAPAKSNGATGVYARASSGFMGQTWDGGDVAFRPETWAAVFRVLKPGAHLLAFSGTRTYHRMVCAIEDAGFEIRDQLAWVYGSGFPKSLDVSKAIDRAAGAEREKVAPRSVIGHQRNIGNRRPYMDNPGHTTDSDTPATPEAAAWQGWGTALKPAWEPICLARKPPIGTVAANVLAHGTGALNIDGCRVEAAEGDYDHPGNDLEHTRRGAKDWRMPDQQAKPHALGRWPANLVHDGSDEVLAGFPETTSGNRKPGDYGLMGYMGAGAAPMPGVDGDTGSAARFFASFPMEDEDCLHQEKLDLIARFAASLSGSCETPTAEEVAAIRIAGFRSAGSPVTPGSTGNFSSSTPILNPAPAENRDSTATTPTTASPSKSSGSAPCATDESINSGRRAGAAGGSAPVTETRFLYCPKADRADRGEGNTHPTVKPGDLMRWLVRLITPPGGHVLDPFGGSGSTGLAASREQFRATLIELSPEYAEIARRRIADDLGPLFGTAAE
jgi:DNA modification methylase